MSQNGKIDRKAVHSLLTDLAPEDIEKLNASRLLSTHITAARKVSAANSTAMALKGLFDVLIYGKNFEMAENDVDDIVFSNAGLDSIKSVSFVRSINQHFGIRMSMVDFLNRETLFNVAKDIDRMMSPASTPVEEIQVDGLLENLEIFTQEVTKKRKSKIGNVFLTDATRYVGTALLKTLLSTSSHESVPPCSCQFC
ncbi:acetyl-CoA synthetase-like protein [Penicillium longicatenatum]|nr:acetyl-CoA synthetase-like protein [Penicillium longicatenatum]